jgi:hypothetical protein
VASGIPRRPDFIDRLGIQENLSRRSRIEKPPRNTENFIIDPVTPFAFPPAFAPPRATLLGAMARLESGGPITVSWVLVRLDPPAGDPNPSVLHTSDIDGDGVVYIEEFDPVDIEFGDYYYPEITSGTGNKFTGSFVVSL